MEIKEPVSRHLIAEVPILDEQNQVVCLCGKPMVDEGRSLVGCSSKQCGVHYDFVALKQWYSSGALTSKKVKLPVCRQCKTCTMYAPMKKDQMLLEPLFKCECKSGRLPQTYYGIEQHEKLYKSFNMSALPVDTRPRTGQKGATVKVIPFDISTLEECQSD